MKLISWQGWPLQRETPLGFSPPLDHAAPPLRNWPIRQVPAAGVLHEVLIVYPAVDVRPHGRASAGGALNLQTSAEPLDAFPHALNAKMPLLHPLLLHPSFQRLDQEMVHAKQSLHSCQYDVEHHLDQQL